VSEFNVPLDTTVISETSLSRQSIALVLDTTKNKETKHCIHPKDNRETEENCPVNKTI